MIWHLYIIRCKYGSLYTGITTDVTKRFGEHVNGNKKGAKYLRGKTPLTLVWKQEVGDKGLALKLEQRIKGLTKTQKEKLIKGEFTIHI